MDPQRPADSVYRLSAAHVLRLVGPVAILLGLVWVAGAVVGASRGWTVGLGAVTIVAACGGAYLFLRPPRILTLTADGYRIGFVRGAGRGAAAWRSVDSVVTAESADGPTLVFSLADGDRSALPLALLGSRHADAQRDVHERLNSAYGYRRF